MRYCDTNGPVERLEREMEVDEERGDATEEEGLLVVINGGRGRIVRISIARKAPLRPPSSTKLL
jgi:hypothetical protein